MKKQTLTSLVLAGMLLLCGCADRDSSGSSTSADASAAETAAAEYDGSRSGDGCYDLVKELKYFKMPLQRSGTCWLYAAIASMQTAYEKQTGRSFEMDPFDILEDIYGDGKQEGIIIRKGIDKGDIGGFQGFVTDRLSGECKNGITLESSMVIDPTDREAIKKAVKTRGGVAASICDRNVEKGKFGGYLTVNYDKPEEYDHYVTIVGWDDSFPKEYFKLPAAEDGAWITYNSNVSGEYYYISYCSPLDHTVSHTVSDKYSEVLSCDAGNEPDCYIKTDGSTKAANVFSKKGRLGAVGTFNDFDRQDIKIEIMSADFKNLLHTQEAVLEYHGYQTVELTQPLDVEDFAVVITYSKGAPVEGESFDTPVGSYKTSIDQGRSFVFAGGEWRDMTDSGIKSLVETGKGQSVLLRRNNALNRFLTDSDIEAMQSTDFSPGNFCIKALFLK